MSHEYAVEYDIEYEELEEQEDIEDLVVPDVFWAKDIENIQDHELKAEEIKKAEDILKEEKALNDKLDKGEIDFEKCRIEHLHTILPKMWKAATKAGQASVDLTPDDFGDISEDNALLQTGDLKMTDLKDRIKKTINDIGPDAAQDHADSMLEEKKLSKDTHERISRQARLQRRSNK